MVHSSKLGNRVLGLYNRTKVYLHNTLWIFADKVFSKAIVFVVAIIVARYLGPEQFGILSYATSMTALFAVTGHMGMVGLVVREIVKKPESRPEILGTSFVLKMIGAICGFIGLMVYALIFENRYSIEFWVLAIASSTILLGPFDVIDFWFQAYVQAKYTTIARTASLFLTAILRVLLVVMGAGIVFFAFANVVNALLVALFLIALFVAKSNVSLRSWNFSLWRAKDLFGQGWLIFLGSFLGIIYLKIDQAMLRWMVGTEEVGIYAVAVAFSESWYFIPAAITASLFPSLIKLKDSDQQRYEQRLQQVFDLLFLLALSVAIVITLFAVPLIDLTIGKDFDASAPILVIHIWAALFIFMRALFSRWILMEDALVFSLITQGAGAFLNVLLNLWLIPLYGGSGAAIATLLSYAMASYFSLFFYKKTRPIFWMMTKSLFSPIFIPLKTIRGKI